MIRIGLNEQEKRQEISGYVERHGIKKTFVFHPKQYPLSIDGPVEYIGYNDIIMYKFFYRLLEEIDDKCLLVFNECLRTQNRSDLTYNCAHHYCGQTPHKIVFEYFPFIEDTADTMILLDLLNKGKYKGKGFAWPMLQDEDVQVKPHPITLETIDIQIAPRDIARYNLKREQLFDALGNGDPDTIPRQLHVFVGNMKKAAISPEWEYVARNKRFNLDNVATYRNIEPRWDYIIIDFPYRRLNFNDFLKATGMERIRFLNSGLPVDQHYISELERWLERLGEFYGKASLCRQ